jgi:hypothetical protein
VEGFIEFSQSIPPILTENLAALASSHAVHSAGLVDSLRFYGAKRPSIGARRNWPSLDIP